MTPHGLELRLSWGDHVLAEHFLRADRTSSFTVGSAPDCAFAMDDVAGPRFEIARSGPDGLELRFAPGMLGEVVDSGGRRDLAELVESGEAVPDGDGYALAVSGDARAELELGAITLSAEVRSCPVPVVVPLADTVDYNLLNIFVVLMALAGGFAVSALNADTEGEGYADGFSPDGRVVAARLLVQNVPASAPVVRQPSEHTAAEGARTRHGQARSPRPLASPRAQARTMLGSIFSGKNGALAAVLGEGAAGGGELQAAVRGLAGSSASAGLGATGFGGLDVRGLGTGGGPGDPYAIGIIGTKGRAAGKDRYGIGYSMCGGPGPGGCLVRADPTVAGDLSVTGGLDPELVRRVIKSHRDQIRYCYEVELAGNASLAGKVAVKFLIGVEGQVATSQVVESTVNSPDLDRCVNGRVQSWVFPKPKGGVVNVRYPFVFTQSGS
ncbi:MAG TPA: AgmX/PglI C-terminal domain-containing protein [Myxococcaceae bacterium]|nr:AgmX/PglI C-terminal domain-containing protein [Myxococcaceae bacterium]